MSMPAIAHNYLTSWFVLDLVAAVPVAFVEEVMEADDKKISRHGPQRYSWHLRWSRSSALFAWDALQSSCCSFASLDTFASCA